MNVDAALYRIYEGCIIPLASQQNSKKMILHTMRVVEFIFLLIAALSFWSVVSLHHQVVKNPGCMPDLISDNVRLSNNTPPHFLGSDEILAIFVNPPSQINMSNPDYEFSRSLSVLDLSRSFRVKHEVQVYNISMTSDCFQALSNFPINLMLPVLTVFGSGDSLVDFVVTNNIMYSLSSSGSLKSFENGFADEMWSWQYYDLIDTSSFSSWIARKLTILTLSLFFFFLVTSTTAMTVRVLINTGFFISTSLLKPHDEEVVDGSIDDDDDQQQTTTILAMPDFFSQYDNAYYANYSIFSSRALPFIMYLSNSIQRHYGVHFVNKSSTPILIALIIELVLMFSFYEASQIAWSLWFANGSLPASIDRASVLLTVMLGEYFSLIFLRSKSSIQVFPRVFAAYFLIFHFYVFSFPSTPIVLTSMCFVFAVLHLMTFCLTRFEVQSTITEHVIAATRENHGLSVDDRFQYRDMYNQLPADLTSSRPLWSVHMPLNASTVSC